MIQINLLPWREQERQEKLTRFAITLAISVACTLLIILILHLYYDGLIGLQQRSNDYLQSVITQKKAELTALQDKKEKQISLQAQLRFIMGLQGESFQAVKLLNGLTMAVPETISLEKIVREGNKVVLSGHAESDIQVTNFMKNLSAIAGFKQPVLTEITTQQTDAVESRYFELKVDLQD